MTLEPRDAASQPAPAITPGKRAAATGGGTAPGAPGKRSLTEGLAADDPAALLAQLGDGAPLDGAIATRMAAAFGQSFADVRIHADEVGGELARAHGAQAFALGNHIAFAPGRYQPGTPGGDELIAHELTHVLQQRGAAPVAQRKAGGGGGDPAEHEADRAAAGVVAQLHGGAPAAPVAPAQRAGVGVQRWGGTPLNTGEADTLSRYTGSFALQGDRFEVVLRTKAGRGPSGRPMLVMTIRYQGSGIPDLANARGELYLPPDNIAHSPKVTPDRPADWADLMIDAFADGSWIGKIHHRSLELPGWTPKSRQHTFSFTGPGKDTSPDQVVTVRSPDARPADPAQPQPATGPEAAAPALKPDVAAAAARLELGELTSDKRFAIDGKAAPWRALAARLDGAKPPGDAARLVRLQETLARLRPMLLALGVASNADAYLPDIAEAAQVRVAAVRGQYEAAIAGVWDGPVDTSRADASFNALWHQLTALYLQRGRGAEALVRSGQGLAQDLVQLSGSGEPAYDRLRNQLGVGHAGNNVLHTAERVDQVRREFERGERGALAKVSAVVEDSQLITGLGALLVTDQMFHRMKHELAGVVGTAADKAPFTRNLTRMCDARIATLEGLAQTVEDALAAAHTQGELAAALRGPGKAAVSKFQAIASSAEFKRDTDDLRSRLKHVKLIETFGKVLAIMGVAALTGGAAGAAVGAALEGAGATVAAGGAFVAEVATFTLVSRIGNAALLGKNETSLSEDLVTNALMMGTLKAAAQVYGKVFRLLADPKKYKVAYAAGGAMTGFVALQMFAEAHALAKTGKAMDWDDRASGLVSNAVMMAAMALGGHLAKVAMTNPELHALAAKNVGPALQALDAQVAALRPHLERVRAGGPGAVDTAAVLVPKIQELWQHQLEVFADAVKAERDPAVQARARERYKATTAMFERELARLDLKLAASGVDVTMAGGGGAHLFEPVRPGFVKYRPGGKIVIEEFYRDGGGKLEKVPGKDGLYRGTDASGETFFAEAGKADALFEDGGRTGAVKGKDVYPEATYVDKDGHSQPAKLNEKKLKDAVRDAKKAPPPGTQLDVVGVAGKTAELRLSVPTGGTTAEVAVQITVKPRDGLAESAAHGHDAGPARLDLVRRADGKWVAKVEVSETMRPEDLQFAIDHELVEAAELVRRYPGGEPKGGFGPELEAGVMKAGARTGHATAHDIAAAHEVVSLWNDHQNLVKNRSPNAPARKQVLERAMESQGLKDSSQVPAKIDLLRKAGAPEPMLAEIKQRESQRVFDEHVQKDLGGKPSSFTPKLIEHLLFPEPIGPAAASGIVGGHHTTELRNYADAPNRYSVREVGTPKPHGGTIYRHFQQYVWLGEIAKKPRQGTPEAPGGAHFEASKWRLLSDPKTTFDDSAAFIADAEQGFARWRSTAPAVPPNIKIQFITPGGVDVVGYLDGTAGPVHQLNTIFPNSAWIP